MRSKVDQRTHAHHIEIVEAGDPRIQSRPAYVRIIVLILQVDRHRRRINFLGNAAAVAGQSARSGAKGQGRRAKLIVIFGIIAVDNCGTQRRPLLANAAFEVEVIAVGRDLAVEEDGIVVLLLAVGTVQEEPCCEVLDVSTGLEYLRMQGLPKPGR